MHCTLSLHGFRSILVLGVPEKLLFCKGLIAYTGIDFVSGCAIVFRFPSVKRIEHCDKCTNETRRYGFPDGVVYETSVMDFAGTHSDTAHGRTHLPPCIRLICYDFTRIQLFWAWMQDNRGKSGAAIPHNTRGFFLSCENGKEAKTAHQMIGALKEVNRESCSWECHIVLPGLYIRVSVMHRLSCQADPPCIFWQSSSR